MKSLREKILFDVLCITGVSAIIILCLIPLTKTILWAGEQSVVAYKNIFRNAKPEVKDEFYVGTPTNAPDDYYITLDDTSDYFIVLADGSDEESDLILAND